GRPAPQEFLNGTTGPERRILLRELLRLDVFYRRQAGETPTAEDYRAGLPDDETVLRQALAGTSDTTDALDDASPPRSHTAPEDRLAGRYCLLRFHARGGLGEVHVAEDTELDREVALKQMQAEFAADPERRGRFVLEGAVTGSLEHPGVVPVYGRGTQADGR